MDEDVRLQRSHEQKRCCAGIANVQSAGGFGAAEVLGDNLETLARRRVRVARIEWQDDRSLRAGEHVYGEVLGKRPLHERNELLSETSQDDAGIRRRINLRQLQDERRNRDASRRHRCREQRVFCREVPKHRGRRHVQLTSDVGQRRGLESLVREDLPGGVQQAVALNDGRASHL
jgi:hypothetical protein